MGLVHAGFERLRDGVLEPFVPVLLRRGAARPPWPPRRGPAIAGDRGFRALDAPSPDATFAYVDAPLFVYRLHPANLGEEEQVGLLARSSSGCSRRSSDRQEWRGQKPIGSRIASSTAWCFERLAATRRRHEGSAMCWSARRSDALATARDGTCRRCRSGSRHSSSARQLHLAAESYAQLLDAARASPPGDNREVGGHWELGLSYRTYVDPRRNHSFSAWFGPSWSSWFVVREWRGGGPEVRAGLKAVLTIRNPAGARPAWHRDPAAVVSYYQRRLASLTQLASATGGRSARCSYPPRSSSTSQKRSWRR